MKSKYEIANDLFSADVLIVDKVNNISLAFDYIDTALMQGIEIICIKNTFHKESYVSNFLIKNGAKYV